MWLRFGLPYILLVALLNILFKMVSHYEIHPVVFGCQSMLVGAIILLQISRPGPLILETVRSAGTWVYGVTFLLKNVLLVYVLQFVDVGMISMMLRVNILMSVLIAWLFLGRVSGWKSLLSLGFIVVGVIALARDLPEPHSGIVIVLALVIAACQSISALAQETHSASNKTRGNIWHECRVTGFVMGTTALFFALVLVMLALIDSAYALNMTVVPTMAQLISPSSLFFSVVYGVFGVSILRWYEFRYIKEIKSEKFMVMLAFVPVLTLAFEYVGAKFGVFDFHGLTALQWFAGAMVLVAAVFYSYFERRYRAQNKAVGSVNKAQRQQIEMDKYIVAHTLEACAGDKAKAAALLGVEESLLDMALRAGDHGEALSVEASRILQESFARNVAVTDRLTGLMNKTQFTALFRKVLQRGDRGAVLMLDLDKFKPVNDTYGHEVGDKVLQIVAQRLQESSGQHSLVSRLGGDEFAVLLTNKSKAKVADICQKIKDKLAEEIVPEEGVAVTVGCSIGVVFFPDDAYGTQVDAFLQAADGDMYGHKGKAKAV